MNSLESNVLDLTNPYIILGFLVAIFLLRFVLPKPQVQRPQAAENEEGYCLRPGLLTRSESAFYVLLKEALRDTCVISFKVRLEDVIGVKRGLGSKLRQSLRNRVSSKHVDFVLTDQKGEKILALIELDDPSHEGKRAQISDQFKNRIASSVGVDLIRFDVREQLTIEKLQNAIFSKINPTEHPAAIQSYLRIQEPLRSSS